MGTSKAFSFPRSRRVTKRADFFRLRKSASKFVSRYWILYYAKNAEAKSRLAVTISARYGNAVDRNAFRRWLREKFRMNQDALGAYDLHFVARQKPTNLSKKRYKEELNEDFQKVLHRLR